MFGNTVIPFNPISRTGQGGGDAPERIIPFPDLPVMETVIGMHRWKKIGHLNEDMRKKPGEFRDEGIVSSAMGKTQDGIPAANPADFGKTLGKKVEREMFKHLETEHGIKGFIPERERGDRSRDIRKEFRAKIGRYCRNARSPEKSTDHRVAYPDFQYGFGRERKNLADLPGIRGKSFRLAVFAGKISPFECIHSVFPPCTSMPLPLYFSL
jgi:hypothetical protein